MAKQISECAACGRNHPIAFRKLESPEIVRGEACTHAGMCPYTDKRVYMSMETK